MCTVLPLPTLRLIYLILSRYTSSFQGIPIAISKCALEFSMFKVDLERHGPRSWQKVFSFRKSLAIILLHYWVLSYIWTFKTKSNVNKTYASFCTKLLHKGSFFVIFIFEFPTTKIILCSLVWTADTCQWTDKKWINRDFFPQLFPPKTQCHWEC